ncbi:MAG TPA: hydroxymethylbilane synthase [Candidatus Udaeobacter sp.]|jgi:hydroxymethylbilane synthase|nr:hydroxymethylbilane synthase [Candidatus Udaeobacter sp.]
MTAESSKIVLGTRGSELARAQARLVEDAIRAARAAITVETKIIATRGDNVRTIDSPAGRKGMFTAEIERALVAGEIDIAVHSAKDLPSEMSSAAEIAAVLPRAAMDDVLVSKRRGGLDSLSHGATVATGSVRRKHQLLWKRADLTVIDLRGNVPTRLRKLVQNEWDAIVLASAGLERLKLSPTHTEIYFEGSQFFPEILPRETFLPAGGQGVIALQIRTDDQSTKAVIDLVNDRHALLCLRAEREFLRGLQGDCNCPVGVVATIEDDKMKMRAQLFLHASAAPREAEVKGVRDDWRNLAAELLRRIEQAQEHEQ